MDNSAFTTGNGTVIGSDPNSPEHRGSMPAHWQHLVEFTPDFTASVHMDITYIEVSAGFSHSMKR